MKTILIILIFVLVGANSIAQQEYSFTNYFEINSFFNPAAVGTEGTQNITGIFRKQWAGFKGSPTSGGIVYDNQLKNLNMGIGGYVVSDKIGALMLNTIAANYSYSLKMSNEHRIAFGIDAGVDIYSTDYDRLIYWDQDAMFENQRPTVVTPRIGAGVHYYSEKLYVGFSVPRLVSYNNDSPISIKSTKLPSVVSNYYLTAGYKFDTGENFKMQFNILGKYTSRVTPQADINFMTTYKNIIGLGVGYKTLGFATTYLQYTYANVVTIGYAFDFTLTEIANYSTGSHEVMIKYRIPNKKITAKPSMF